MISLNNKMRVLLRPVYRLYLREMILLKKDIDYVDETRTSRKNISSFKCVISGRKDLSVRFKSARYEHRFSDVDVAIDEAKNSEFSAIGEAKDVMEALYIPYKVDVVDFHRIPEGMREMILGEGIRWK